MNKELKGLRGMRPITWIIFGWLVLGATALAASFDCAKAQSRVEHLICDNTEISKLDEELNATYKNALKDEKQAASIKQEQKQWMRGRNSCFAVDCLINTYQKRINALTSKQSTMESTIHTLTHFKNKVVNSGVGLGEEQSKISTDQPSNYRLGKSTNDRVCSLLNEFINMDIRKYGKTRFDSHGEFVKWHKVEEDRIDRGGVRKYDGMVEQAEVDINNDGVVDQVIRSKWSIRGVLEDMLHILPAQERTIAITELIKLDKMISFNSNNYWLDRYKKKYGDSRFDWVLNGVASIDLLQRNEETYVVAQNYAAPLNVSARIYVFQLDKEYRKYQEKDVCMFVKVCPCGGCIDLHGDEFSESLPAKRWCNN